MGLDDDVRVDGRAGWMNNLATPEAPGTTVCFRARINEVHQEQSGQDRHLVVSLSGITGTLNGEPMAGKGTSVTLVYPDDLEPLAEMAETLELVNHPALTDGA